MYYKFEETLDGIFGRYKNKVKKQKHDISKEKEQSQKDLSKVCDCEEYCYKYKVKESQIVDEPKKINSKPTPGILSTIANFFNKKATTKKPVEPPVETPVEPPVETPVETPTEKIEETPTEKIEETPIKKSEESSENINKYKNLLVKTKYLY